MCQRFVVASNKTLRYQDNNISLLPLRSVNRNYNSKRNVKNRFTGSNTGV